MAKQKYDRGQGHFAGIPDRVMDHPDYYNLSFSAKALLLEFAKQYRKTNNGKLCAVHSQLKPRGWNSDSTLRTNLKELREANLIIVTKYGLYGAGKRLPNYYAITWQPIDEIKGFTMDVEPTVTPPRKFSCELRLVKNQYAA
jgi:hypothetical protein